MSNQLPSATPPPSSSGARLAGDDLQHLISWYFALRMLSSGSGIRTLTLEARDAGNLDDIVVEYEDDRFEYYQVKAATSDENLLSTEWMLRPGRSDAPSILQRFWATWEKVKTRGAPHLELLTNRSRDSRDPVFNCRDENALLAHRLRRAKAGTPEAAGRARWAKHLGVSEEELCELLDVLRFSTDATEASWRRAVIGLSEALGLSHDEQALLAIVGKVREWIQETRRPRTTADVERAIDELHLRMEPPYSSLVVQALGHEISPEGQVLDWVDRFRGDSERNRRGLHQPNEWTTVLLVELREACRRAIHENGRVMVRGRMRLPCWFACGASLSRQAGVQTVASAQNGVMWKSDDLGQLDEPEVITMDEQRIGDGDEIAITVAISQDPSPDVRAYLQGHPAVGLHLTLALAPGPGQQTIAGSAAAAAAAMALRNAMRAILGQASAPAVHLFLAMPSGLALLLGHFWDRLPRTQLYEDLFDSYEPAFLID